MVFVPITTYPLTTDTFYAWRHLVIMIELNEEHFSRFPHAIYIGDTADRYRCRQADSSSADTDTSICIQYLSNQDCEGGRGV